MKKQALIVWGGWDGHSPEECSNIFAEILIQEGFDVDISDTLDVFTNKGKLSKLDLLIPVWTMGKIEQEYVANISQAINSGMGIAGCHGGMCDAFRENTEWQFITGSQWVAHPGSIIEYKVNICKSSSSPIIENINDFIVKTEQYYIHYDPAVNVLATTTFPVADGPHAANGDVKVPVVYTKYWGKGKVFYCSIGHQPSDFSIPEVKLLIKRGFRWASNMEVIK